MSELKKTMHVAISRGDVGEYVLLPGSPERAVMLSKLLDNCREVAYNREYRTFTGELDGVRVSVTSTGMGGPSVGIAVEELYECGARTFLRVGTCESASPRVAKGDLILPNGAVRMEGVSRQYAPIGYPAVPNMGLLREVHETLDGAGYGHLVGIAVTKARFSSQFSAGEREMDRENAARWNMYRDGGALCGEMGCASLFVIASSLDARAAAILMSNSDYGAYSPFEDDDAEEQEQKLCATGIAALRGVIAAER